MVTAVEQWWLVFCRLTVRSSISTKGRSGSILMDLLHSTVHSLRFSLMLCVAVMS